MISEFDDESWAKWTLAHELGHKLNLYDVFQAYNLMQAEEYLWNHAYKIIFHPVSLMNDQAHATRDWAYEKYCVDESCVRDDLDGQIV